MRTVEQSVDAQQPDDTFPVGHVCIRKQPQLHLAPIDVGNQSLQRDIRVQHILQRQCIVDFAVVLQRVNFVMLDEALNREAVGFVVRLAKVFGVGRCELWKLLVNLASE